MHNESTAKESPIIISLDISDMLRARPQKRRNEEETGLQESQSSLPQVSSTLYPSNSRSTHPSDFGDKATGRPSEKKQAQDSIVFSTPDEDYTADAESVATGVSQDREYAASLSTSGVGTPRRFIRTDSGVRNADEHNDVHVHAKRKAEDSGHDQNPRKRKEPVVHRINGSSNESSATSQGIKPSKTAKEQDKGKAINKTGVKADRACDDPVCRANPDSCIVPLDPRPPQKSTDGFNTFKCGRCVAKKSGCSFDKNNLPREYPPEILKDCPDAAKRARNPAAAKDKGTMATEDTVDLNRPDASSATNGSRPAAKPKAEEKMAGRNAIAGGSTKVNNSQDRSSQTDDRTKDQEAGKPQKPSSLAKGKIDYVLNSPDDQAI